MIASELATYLETHDYCEGDIKDAIEMLRELDELKSLVKSFFDDYLNVLEVSDGGRVFNPIYISCCRSLKMKSLGILLDRMQDLSGAKKNDSKSTT